MSKRRHLLKVLDPKPGGNSGGAMIEDVGVEWELDASAKSEYWYWCFFAGGGGSSWLTWPRRAAEEMELNKHQFSKDHMDWIFEEAKKIKRTGSASCRP
jgi:hypothetical protein